MSFDKLYLGGNITDLDLGKSFEKYIEVVFNFEGIDGEQKTVLYSTADDWKPNHHYSVNDIVAYETSFYTCKTAHTSGSSFDASKWDEKKTDAQVLEMTMPVLTDATYAQQIAQNVFTTLNQGQHRPYTAREAVLDPAFQLGDGVTMDDFYSIIGTATEVCDALYTVDVSAKGRDETEDEFVYKPTTEKNLQRQITKTRTSFKIGIDGVKAMVSGLAAPWVSNTSYTIGEIVEHENKFYRCIVSNSDTTFDPDKWTEIDSGVVESILQLAVGKMTLSVSGDGSGSSIVLTSGNVRITSAATYFDTDEAHFSGSLSANKISAGSIDADVVSVKDAFAVQMEINNVWTTVGYVGAATGLDGSGNTTRGAVLKSADGNSYVIATNAGVRMQQGNTGLWIADNAISYRINGGTVIPLGYAVFS